MYRHINNNTVIGLLNLFTLLASITIIGAGLWMPRSSPTCENFLQTPLLVIGFLLLVVSIAGFIGACFNVTWILWFYLVVMFFLIAALTGLTIFGFDVSSMGGGVDVPGMVSKEYHLQDYSPWLRKRVHDPSYWNTIRSCIVGSKTCQELAYWTPPDYIQSRMSPIQSGCCKAQSICNYNVTTMMMREEVEADCNRWNSASNLLCYDCDSCKAGVLEDIRGNWHKLLVITLIMLLLLIVIYFTACFAFRNTTKTQTVHPSAENQMANLQSNDYHLWPYDRREDNFIG